MVFCFTFRQPQGCEARNARQKQRAPRGVNWENTNINLAATGMDAGAEAGCRECKPKSFPALTGGIGVAASH